MEHDPRRPDVPLFDFVDEFRRSAPPEMPDGQGLNASGRTDALPAPTVEELRSGRRMAPPPWTMAVPAPESPWFVSGMDSLKAIALAESPVHFRKRKIFVPANFLDRV